MSFAEDLTPHHPDHLDPHLEGGESEVSVEELKRLLADHLRSADRLKKPEGIPTGFSSLDSFLCWGGLPKGALTLVSGALGTGGTSLWIEAAAYAVHQKKWVAWVSCDVPLMPLSLQQKGMNLGQFVAIEAPEKDEKLLWLLQELMSSQLFDLIGCDLGERQLREHQLRKLQAQARESHVALTFLTRKPSPKGAAASLYSLILRFEKRRILIERALHRPTPHSFHRSVSYARFTVHTEDRIGSRASHTSDHSGSQPDSLPASARSTAYGRSSTGQEAPDEGGR